MTHTQEFTVHLVCSPGGLPPGAAGGRLYNDQPSYDNYDKGGANVSPPYDNFKTPNFIGFEAPPYDNKENVQQASGDGKYNVHNN